MMAGVRIKFEEVKPLLQNVMAHLQDSQPMFNAMGFQIQENVLSRLARGVTPEGTPFKPVGALTAQARQGAKGGERPLQDTSTIIPPSIGYSASATGFKVGSEWQFMPVHQEGRTIYPKSGHRFLAVPLNPTARRLGVQGLRSQGLFRPHGTRVLAIPSGEGFTPMFALLAKAVIPARPLFGWSEDEDIPLLKDIVRDFADAAFGGAE